MKTHTTFIIGTVTLLLSAAVSFGEIKILTEHISNTDATAQFKFKNIPAPADKDAAAKAKFVVVAGEPDGNGSDVSALNDGKLPPGEDEPSANYFFAADTEGGRVQVDLGSVIRIKQINSYSWHPNTRGPQVYKLYASDGTAAGFNGRPENGLDPEKVGWKLIAKVDTRPKDGEGGGQYGVSISDSEGTVGQYRYLLFDCSRTESDDGFGNTFYSEIDVVSADSKAEAKTETAATLPGVQVSLVPFFNVIGIYKDGKEFGEGLDGQGFGCSAELLGTSQTWQGTKFNISPAGVSNVVNCAGQTIPLSAGKFSTLKMLALAVNGNQESQNFTVTYGDNSTQKYTRSLSDWFTPASYPGESEAVNMSYRNQSDGTKAEQTFLVYGYVFNLNQTNAVKSVTLPANNDVKIFALTLVP
jgi:hypothetical protein